MFYKFTLFVGACLLLPFGFKTLNSSRPKAATLQAILDLYPQSPQYGNANLQFLQFLNSTSIKDRFAKLMFFFINNVNLSKSF